LLVNLPFAGLPLSLFLAPGSLLIGFFLKPERFGPPLPVLAANALIYSGIAYVLPFIRRSANAEKMHRIVNRLAVPVVALVALACIPALNPLWPQGISELARQEKELQSELPLGMRLTDARAVLRSRGIQFNESAVTESSAVLSDFKGETITAVPGDRLIQSRFGTDAFDFPCGFDMRICLVFSPDEKLKRQYVHRFPMCP